MFPLQVLMGNMTMANLLAISPNCPLLGGTCPCKSLPNCISGACTLFGNQKAMPFTWQRGDIATVRGWRSCRNICGATPHKWRNGMPFAELLKRSWQEDFSKDSDLEWRARGPTLWWTTLVLLTRIHMICLIHFGKWRILQAFLNWTSMKFRMHGWGGKISAPPVTLPKLHRKIYSSSIWWLQWNCQASWDWKGFIPPKSFTGRVAAHIAYGVPEKGKMRGPWLTTSKQPIIT